MVHPSLTQGTFDIFNCVEVEGKSYLVSDISIVCGSSEHGKLIGIGVILLLGYVLGIPLGAYLLLLKNRSKLSDSDTRFRYSFLFRGYVSQHYYWEVFVIFRKVALITIAVFFGRKPQVQTLLAVLLVTVALLGHVLARPFDKPVMFYMELFSLCNSFVTFYLGQFLFIDSIGNSQRSKLADGLGYIIVILNATFLLVFLAVVGMSLTNWWKERKRQDSFRQTAVASMSALSQSSIPPITHVLPVELSYSDGPGIIVKKKGSSVGNYSEDLR